MEKHIKYLYIIVVVGFLSISVQLWMQYRVIQTLEIKVDAIRELLFRFV
ncbi:MAG: hypothetical protein IIB95_13400 [Candidatus Marinimicrobia bacterium]|nr:hypothetical protein [Candidatus Neomarinimicrobiota bacterium]MCH7764708.1 hypothetical protein [Candidatus Neomarinimicrobiota bacterium]